MDSLNAAFVHFLFLLNPLSGLRVNRDPTGLALVLLLHHVRIRQLLKFVVACPLLHDGLQFQV